MTELRTDLGFDEELAAVPPVMEEYLPRGDTPIVPKRSIAGRALVAVVSIMTFLASLTTGAVMLVRSSAVEWQSDVAREVTIQVRPGQGRDLDAEVNRAVGIARAIPGVGEVRAELRRRFVQHAWRRGPASHAFVGQPPDAPMSNDLVECVLINPRTKVGAGP